MGRPVLPMPNSPKTGSPRFSIIHEDYQVVVDPFWKNGGRIILPTHANQAWIVTAYQMEARRKSDMEAWMARPGSEVPIRRIFP